MALPVPWLSSAYSRGRMLTVFPGFHLINVLVIAQHLSWDADAAHIQGTGEEEKPHFLTATSFHAFSDLLQKSAMTPRCQVSQRLTRPPFCFLQTRVCGQIWSRWHAIRSWPPRESIAPCSAQQFRRCPSDGGPAIAWLGVSDQLRGLRGWLEPGGDFK